MTTLFNTQTVRLHTYFEDMISHMFYWKVKTIRLTMTTGTSSLPSTSAMCSNLLPPYHEQNTHNNHFKISATISLVNIFSIHTASHMKLMESITKQMICCLFYILEPSKKQHAAFLSLLCCPWSNFRNTTQKYKKSTNNYFNCFNIKILFSHTLNHW